MRMRSLVSGPIIVSFLLALALSIAVIGGSPIDDPYFASNTEWNGVSQLAAKGLQVTSDSLEETLAPISPPALLVVLAPAKAFTESEAVTIRRFVEGGGVLLLGDSFGSANSLLEQLEVPARFEGSLLVDPLFFRKQSSFPRVWEVQESEVTQGVSELLLNYATILDVRDSSVVEILASSSKFSFLDSNRNLQKEELESSGSFPVLAEVRLGQGRIILFTSPGSLVNSVLAEADNSALAENAIALAVKAKPGATLLLDQTHLVASPSMPVKLEARRFLKGILTGNMTFLDKLMSAALALVIVAGRYGYRKPSQPYPPPKPRRMALGQFDVDRVMAFHPSWDRGRLEYVKKELENTSRWRQLHDRK